MLGDVKMRGSPDRLDTGQGSGLADSDRKMLDKVALPEERHRFRSRFLSMSKSRRQRRRCYSKLSTEGRLLVDEFYNSPARLLLTHIGDWKFNIFNLDGLSNGRSLFHVAYHLFQTYDLIRGFQLDSVRLMQFFTLVEQNYHDTNPYHNAVHAADVTQAMHCYLQERELYESTTEVDKMVALVAALTHDLDHPGVNNMFLIVTSNHLATLYQNISVLENHHYRSAVGLLQETGVLSHFSHEQRISFFAQLKALILATDITRQQEFLLKFCRYIEGGEFQYRRNEEHRLFLLQIALKCADISNPCRPWKISQRWSRRICHEFFLQGDTERALNVAVTPLCDRFGNTVANIQHGFMQFVVNPLYKAWDKFLSTELTAQMMSHLAHNQGKWKSIMDSGQEICEEDTDSEEGKFDGEEEETVEEEGKTEEKVAGGDGTKEEDMEVTSESMAAVGGSGDLGEVSQDEEVEVKPAVTVRHHEEEEEGRSEEDDIVENDVNLVYHYQTESEESGRCLSPVSEDSEQGIPYMGTIRRYSVPHVVRKDLNFYLGLRKDGSMGSNSFLRRQSLPVTAMYFYNTSSGGAGGGLSAASDPESRSLSMQDLLARPKISNLSPNLETSFIGGGLDPLSLTPLKNQTLMLQGGSLTRFTTNPTTRRASYEPALSEHLRSATTSDLLIPPFKQELQCQQQPVVGLASSWPSVARRRTTNGSTPHHATSPDSSSQTPNKSNFPSSLQHPSTSSTRLGPDDEDNDVVTAQDDHGMEASDPHHQQHNNNNHSSNPNPQCLSMSVGSTSQEGHDLARPQ